VDKLLTNQDSNQTKQGQSLQGEHSRVFQQLIHNLPNTFFDETSELQLHHLMVAADKVFQPKGTWVLLNADMTFTEAFGEMKISDIVSNKTLKEILTIK